MSELILSHRSTSGRLQGKNVGVKNALNRMNSVLSRYREMMRDYRPPLNGERYLTDYETAEILKVSRRTLQEYRNNGVLPYYQLGGKVLYRESDLEAVLQKCYHPALKVAV